MSALLHQVFFQMASGWSVLLIHLRTRMSMLPWPSPLTLLQTISEEPSPSTPLANRSQWPTPPEPQRMPNDDVIEKSRPVDSAIFPYRHATSVLPSPLKSPQTQLPGS